MFWQKNKEIPTSKKDGDMLHIEVASSGQIWDNFRPNCQLRTVVNYKQKNRKSWVHTNNRQREEKGELRGTEEWWRLTGPSEDSVVKLPFGNRNGRDWFWQKISMNAQSRGKVWWGTRALHCLKVSLLISYKEEKKSIYSVKKSTNTWTR